MSFIIQFVAKTDKFFLCRVFSVFLCCFCIVYFLIAWLKLNWFKRLTRTDPTTRPPSRCSYVNYSNLYINVEIS